MATVISIPNGETHLFFGDNRLELQSLIREKLGLEAESIYKGLLDERNEMLDYLASRGDDTFSEKEGSSICV